MRFVTVNARALLAGQAMANLLSQLSMSSDYVDFNANIASFILYMDPCWRCELWGTHLQRACDAASLTISLQHLTSNGWQQWRLSP